MFARCFVFTLLISQVGFLGCHHRCHQLWNNVCRTVKQEPKCFDYCDRSAVFHEMACCFWAKNQPTQPCSEHFRSGFLDGFADYLHRGGTGQAPVLPPRRYWEPNGGVCRLNVIEEWRTGFTAGAESAKESGMRQQIVISYDGEPVSDRGITSVRQANFHHAETEYIEASIVPSQMTEAAGPIYAYDAETEGTPIESQTDPSVVELPAIEQHASPEPTIIQSTDDPFGE